MSDSLPLVSIVIPSYRGMPFLPESVTSALAQGYPNLEVIVIENASNDGSADWLRACVDSRLRVVYREDTQSAADNWTQAVLESRGDFVKLVCADDTIEPRTVSQQVTAMQTHPGAVMAAARRRVIDANGRALRLRHGLGSLHGLVDGAAAVRTCLLAGANSFGEPAAVMFSGPILRSVMPWRSTWPYVIDVATYTEVLRHGPVFCDHDILASFRVSGASWSSELLGDQYTQFRAWRDSVLDSGFVRFSALDRMRADASLRAQTLMRQVYFKREARRSRLAGTGD